MQPERRGRLAVVVLAVGASLLVGLGAAMVLGAGGDDDDSGDVPETTELSQREQLIRHISAYTYEVGGVGTIGPSEADCVAKRIVDGVGVDRLVELDVLHTLEDPNQPPLVIGDAAQETYADAFDCLDDQALVAFLAGTIQRSTDAGPDQAHCMVQGWLDGMGRDDLVAMYTVLSTEGVSGDSLNSLPADRRDLLLDVAQSCATPPPTAP